MATLLDKVDNLINTIDESKDNNDECSIVVLGMGNPLLDISSPVDEAFMKKYGIKPSNAILAEDKHLPMYEELAKMENVEYIGGGSTLNSIRVIGWMSQQKGNVGYMGCIGDDKFGKLLESNCKDAGVDCFFMKDSETPTGTCAVCITDKERSLVANLAAANKFNKSHCDEAMAKTMIATAKLIYTAGFFITVSLETMIMLGEACKEAKKPYCLNLSAEFITTVFRDQLNSVMPFVNVVFANEDESQSFAKANGIKFDNMKDLAVKISEYKCEKGSPRTCIITQGADAVLVAKGDKVTEYPVPKIDKEKIVDTNGAGDAFVGGFLSQFVNDKEEKVCVAAGTYAAQYMIQRAGTKLEGKPTFKE